MIRLILIIMIFILLSSLTLAVDYTVLEEYHGLTDHYIILEIDNPGLAQEELKPSIDITSYISNFNIRDQKVELITTQQIPKPIYEPVLDCNIIKDENGSNVEICEVLGQNLIRTDYKQVIVLNGLPSVKYNVFYGKRIEAENDLEIPKGESKKIKISWRTPIYSLSGGWGSYGAWIINPSGYWNTSLNKSVNITRLDLADTVNYMTINYNISNTSVLGNMQSDCGDLRIVDENGTNELPYLISYCNTSDSVYIRAFANDTWVGGETKQFQLYYDTAIADNIA